VEVRHAARDADGDHLDELGLQQPPLLLAQQLEQAAA
jgi:hypothetical protein